VPRIPWAEAENWQSEQEERGLKLGKTLPKSGKNEGAKKLNWVRGLQTAKVLADERGDRKVGEFHSSGKKALLRVLTRRTGTERPQRIQKKTRVKVFFGNADAPGKKEGAIFAESRLKGEVKSGTQSSTLFKLSRKNNVAAGAKKRGREGKR